MIDWANSNTDELVLLYLSHFDGASTCETDAKAAMATLGVHVAACSELSGLTVDGAMTLGALSGGGRVLATDGCVAENYDSSITCYKNPFSVEKFQKTEVRTTVVPCVACVWGARTRPHYNPFPISPRTRRC